MFEFTKKQWHNLRRQLLLKSQEKYRHHQKNLLITLHFISQEPKVSKLWQEVKESGVLGLELLHHVFSKFLLKGAAKDDILVLMEQFGLIAKFSPSKTDEKYFVPC